MLKKAALLLVSLLFLAVCLAGCDLIGEGPAPASSKQPTTTAATAPVIESVDAFLKKDTAEKKSDMVCLSVRHVEYDGREEKFGADFKVFLNDEQISYQDVSPLGMNYYWVSVDLPEGVTSGSVYVTYGNVKSNVEQFSLE